MTGSGARYLTSPPTRAGDSLVQGSIAESRAAGRRHSFRLLAASLLQAWIANLKAMLEPSDACGWSCRGC